MSLEIGSRLRNPVSICDKFNDSKIHNSGCLMSWWTHFLRSEYFSYLLNKYHLRWSHALKFEVLSELWQWFCLERFPILLHALIQYPSDRDAPCSVSKVLCQRPCLSFSCSLDLKLYSFLLSMNHLTLWIEQYSWYMWSLQKYQAACSSLCSF